MRSRVQAAEMGFLQNVKDLSLFDIVKSTDICQSFNIEPLLLCIERLQLRWYGHVTRMSYEQIKWMLFRVVKGLEGNPELAGGIMLKTWPCRVSEFHRRNSLVARARDAWRFQLGCCPRNLKRTSGQREIH